MDREESRKREAGFLSYEGDVAAVYRVSAGEKVNGSEPLEQVRQNGESPIVSGYDLILTGPIMRGVDAPVILDEYRVNSFVKPGDIVAFKQAGEVTCWYVDQLSYSRLPGLLGRCLAAAEMSVEGNCSQIHRLAAQNILECQTLLGASPIERVSMDILESPQAAADTLAKRDAPKPSLLDTLRQCREAIGKCQGGVTPPNRVPER